MSLDKAIQNLKFDIRMIEHLVATGQLTKEEVKKHLESLPDLASNAEKITIDGDNHQDSSQQQH